MSCLWTQKETKTTRRKVTFRKRKTNVDKVRRWEERGREWTVEDRKKGTRRLLGYFAWPAYASSYLYVEDVVAWFRVGTRQCGASLAGEGFHLRQHVCNVRALHCCIR